MTYPQNDYDISIRTSGGKFDVSQFKKHLIIYGIKHNPEARIKLLITIKNVQNSTPFKDYYAEDNYKIHAQSLTAELSLSDSKSAEDVKIINSSIVNSDLDTSRDLDPLYSDLASQVSLFLSHS